MLGRRGAEIQFRQRCIPSEGWFNYEHEKSPAWTDDYEYRIKPKADEVIYAIAHNRGGDICRHGDHNLKLTFDGETGKLKSAEVLK